jgi:two-component system, sensor histidine kinase
VGRASNLIAKWRARALTPLTVGSVALTIAGLVLLINMVNLFTVLNERGRAQIDSVREDTVWAAYQLEREANRLGEVLREPVVRDAAWVKEVGKRFDILYSRTTVLSEGQLHARFGEVQELEDLTQGIRNEILALTPAFDAAARDGEISPGRRTQLRAAVAGIEERASHLIIATNARHDVVKVAERAEVKSYYEQMAWTAGGLAALFVAFILLLALQLRAIRRLSETSRQEAAAAAAANRAKSAFLAAMSHEIRTPLNGILGMAELMADGELSSIQSAQIGVIRSSGDMLLDVINDILDFSKLESGGIDLSMTSFSLAEVAQSVVDMMRPRAEGKNLRLELDCANVSVTSDPARLRQVLVNMVGNAIKFTASGSVKISASVIGGAGGRSGLRLEIADTGIGMSAETRAQLFQEFVQGDPSISRRFGGTGLGLAICKRLIVAMGGTIEVESTEGAGSRFTIEIPCEVTDAVEQSTAPIVVGPPAGQAHVLIVEDNPVNQLVAQGLLQKMGMTVSCVGDGAAAVEAVRSAAYDLVLMDMQMPIMDGLTATRIIRAEGNAVPIIGLTANAFVSDRDACLAAGMDAFLTKPITRAKLEDTLWPILRGSPPALVEVPSDAAPLVDLVQQNALIAELGQEQFDELMHMFGEDARSILVTLGQLEITEELIRAMHSLKGMARTLGLTAIGDAAAEGEMTLRSGKLPDLTEITRLLEPHGALAAAAKAA